MSAEQLTPADVNREKHPLVLVKFEHPTYGQIYGRIMWDFSSPTLWRVRLATAFEDAEKRQTIYIRSGRYKLGVYDRIRRVLYRRLLPSPNQYKGGWE